MIGTKSLHQNIFYYATSELSQDAFISLLVAWFYSDNKELKHISEEFISALFKVYHKKTLDISKIKSINIIQQHYKIDIYFDVNYFDGTSTPFIIEDKTWTEPHSNQLKRYVQKVSGVKSYPEKENKKTGDIVKIFFKTGHITEKDREETKIAKYSIIDTKWMYDFLSKYDKVDNVIFRQYKEFLVEKFYDKLYNYSYKKGLKDWDFSYAKEGYVQYAIIENIKKVVQNNIRGTNNSYIKYTKNGKLWDTWWSFYVEKNKFSMFVKIKKIDGTYRIRLIRYASKKDHDFTGEEFNKHLDILNSNDYENIHRTKKSRSKARETEIAFLELTDLITLEEAVKVFSEFLITFISKLRTLGSETKS